LLKQSMPCESKNAFLAPFYAQESRRDERKRRFMSIKWRIHLIEGAVQQPLVCRGRHTSRRTVMYSTPRLSSVTRSVFMCRRMWRPLGRCTVNSRS